MEPHYHTRFPRLLGGIVEDETMGTGSLLGRIRCQHGCHSHSACRRRFSRDSNARFLDYAFGCAGHLLRGRLATLEQAEMTTPNNNPGHPKLFNRDERSTWRTSPVKAIVFLKELAREGFICARVSLGVLWER